MLDNLRVALYTALIIVAFFLYQAWQKDHPPVNLPPAVTNQTLPAARYVPQTAAHADNVEAALQTTRAQTKASAPMPVQNKLIKVTTDLLQMTIDTRGGEIVEVKLLAYPESLGSKQPFLLLNDDIKNRYIAESGLLSKQGPDTSEQQAIYTSTQTAYQMSPNQNDLIVKLDWQSNGIKVTKIFTFARKSYEVRVGFEVDNQSSAPWQGNLYAQLMRTDSPPANNGGLVNLATYFGAAVSTPQKPFEKITFKQMLDKNFSITSQDGWVAMIQHYFISAWVPPSNTTSTYYSHVSADGLYSVGLMGPLLTVAPKSSTFTEAKLYTGPAKAGQLEKTAANLKLTIDYGWFWFISAIIFWMMQKIYDVIGNWGWSIVFVTLIIKLLFYQLSAKSYRSMSALKKLQPRMEMLKERYADDKQKLTQATMELYREEKINPLSGCLPVLIQIPVFIALYWVLVESVELRQAPFMLWIHDLSQHDPYYILPLLMGASMFIQQRLNPPPADPFQAKLMMLMPIIFTVLFANFPAGLMLYWFVNNTLSFVQQWYIMHRVSKETNAKK